jgi:hypothetical protein
MNNVVPRIDLSRHPRLKKSLWFVGIYVVSIIVFGVVAFGLQAMVPQ